MKHYIITILAFSLGLMSLSIGFSEPSRFEGKIVKKIEFIGLNNTSTEELLYEMTTTEGYPLKSSEVRKDLKAVFDKGKLEKVEVEIEEYNDGVRLRFICVERPLVDSIVYKGIGELNESELQEIVLLKSGDVFRIDLLEKSIKLIHEKYDTKGLFNASVSYKIRNVKNGSDVIVDIIVDEGEEIKVEKISVFGADKLYYKEVLGAMETKERGIIEDGVFNKEKYEEDKGKILTLYKQSGYLDAQIVYDNIEYQWKNPSKQKDRVIYITISITEGEKYYFDGYTIDIKGQGEKTVFTPEQISQGFVLNKQGSVFNNSMFEADRQMIAFRYASEGYIFTRILPQRTVTEKEVTVKGVTEKRKYVSVHFSVDEGSQAYIESVIIRGNKKTFDKVIRREIICKEGELFDSRKVQLSRERVYNLGFFKEVNIDARPGSRDGLMNLIFEVQEQPSATISVGGGYGTTSGFSIFADVTERNFRGRGQTLGLKVEYGPLRSSVAISFVEPWLLDDYPLAFNSSIFYNLYTIETSSMFSSSEIARYDKQGFGYSLGLSYRFWYYYVIGTAWIHEFKMYLNATGNNTDTVFVAVAEGLQEKRTQRFYLYRDSKDNYLNPTSGTRIGASVSFNGGILGGDDHFMRWAPEAALYWSPFHLPFLKDWRCVFEFRASGTFLTQPFGSVRQNPEENQWIEPEDRLLIGGPETVRGWDYYDSSLPDSWASTGLFHRMLYGAEFRVPIHPQMLWMAFFFDAGALFSDNRWESQIDPDSLAFEEISKDRANGELYTLRDFIHGETHPSKYFKYGYGVGFRIQIPMMPLRFWFGRKAVYEDGGLKNLGGMTFQFQIGDYKY
ncbi:MAG: outer membrane protein assembly factor BamA [Spirochaetia bacterium]|jgi:outer membrane protein insertion porin family|nr:outer membrane protein assembly factor BamA [Spirochaetia bacterium]